MEAQIITIFCIVDDILKSIAFKDDWQVQMTTSEVITIALSSSQFFGGNFKKACDFFKEYKLVKNMLSKSQFNRRLHKIEEYIWEIIFNTLASLFKERNGSKEYAADSFPIPVCHNIRIKNCKLYREEKYRGYCASKRSYFYGLRGHVIVTKKGEPVELVLAPGSYSDARILKDFQFDLPQGSTVYGDSLYSNYEYEAIIKESQDINLLAARKNNSKQPHDPWVTYLISCGRKIVETAFSQITSLFPKKIHAVTSHCFQLKIICFVLAYAFTLL